MNKIKFAVQAVDNASRPIDNISRNINNLGNSSKNANTPLGKLANLLDPNGAMLLGIGALGGSALLLYNRIKSLTDESAKLADNIDKTSARLAMGVEEFQKLDFVLQQCGTSANQMQRAFQDFRKRQIDVSNGNQQVIQSFEHLGINQDFITQNANNQNELFKETILRLSEIDSELHRADAAQKIFGNGSREILPLLRKNTEQIEELFNATDKYNLVMREEVVANLNEYKDTSDKASQAQAVLRSEIANLFTPALTRMAEVTAVAASRLTELFRGPTQETQIDRLKDRIKEAEERLNYVITGQSDSLSNLNKLALDLSRTSQREMDQFVEIQSRALERMYNELWDLQEEQKKKIEDDQSLILEVSPEEIQKQQDQVTQAMRALQDTKTKLIEDDQALELRQLELSHTRQLEQFEDNRQAQLILIERYELEKQIIYDKYTKIELEKNKKAAQDRMYELVQARQEYFDKIEEQERKSNELIDILQHDRRLKEIHDIEDHEERRLELELYNFDRRMERLYEQYEHEHDLLREYEIERKEQIYQDSANRQLEISRKTTEAERAINDQRVNNIIHMLSNVGSEHTRFNNFMKNVGVVSSTINTFASAMNIFRTISKLPTPGARFLAATEAAATIGYGLTQVSKIRALNSPRYVSGGFYAGEQGKEFIQTAQPSIIHNNYETKRMETRETNISLTFQNQDGLTIGQLESSIENRDADRLLDMVFEQMEKRNA